MNIYDLIRIFHEGTEAELREAVEELCSQYTSYDEFCEINYEEVKLLRKDNIYILDHIIDEMYKEEE